MHSWPSFCWLVSNNSCFLCVVLLCYFAQMYICCAHIANMFPGRTGGKVPHYFNLHSVVCVQDRDQRTMTNRHKYTNRYSSTSIKIILCNICFLLLLHIFCYLHIVEQMTQTYIKDSKLIVRANLQTEDSWHQPLVLQISIRLTTFSCLSSCRILISLRAVIGNWNKAARGNFYNDCLETMMHQYELCI